MGVLLAGELPEVVVGQRGVGGVGGRLGASVRLVYRSIDVMSPIGSYPKLTPLVATALPFGWACCVSAVIRCSVSYE